MRQHALEQDAQNNVEWRHVLSVWCELVNNILEKNTAGKTQHGTLKVVQEFQWFSERAPWIGQENKGDVQSVKALTDSLGFEENKSLNSAGWEREVVEGENIFQQICDFIRHEATSTAVCC